MLSGLDNILDGIIEKTTYNRPDGTVSHEKLSHVKVSQAAVFDIKT
jgi:hypothetical protein